jgi:hypothetical protein
MTRALLCEDTRTIEVLDEDGSGAMRSELA